MGSALTRCLLENIPMVCGQSLHAHVIRTCIGMSVQVRIHCQASMFDV